MARNVVKFCLYQLSLRKLSHKSHVTKDIIKHGQLFTCSKELCTKASNIADEPLIISKPDGDDSGICLLGINRPAVKNAINFRLLEQISDVVEEIKHDGLTRVAILYSRIPGTFCAGADLKERKDLNPKDYQRWSHTIRAVFTSFADLPVPTIAAVDGYALGGGAELALSCDLIVGAKNAKLGFPETGLAIIPGAGGTQRLSRLVGPSVAKDLILTGRIIDGEEAYRLGIVNYLTHQNKNGDAAMVKALEVARIMLKKGPMALQMGKTAISKGIEVDLKTGLSIEQGCYDQIIPTTDRLEALAAFSEKRPPIFKGK